jgi:hypothetical protein
MIPGELDIDRASTDLAAVRIYPKEETTAHNTLASASTACSWFLTFAVRHADDQYIKKVRPSPLAALFFHVLYL